MRRGREGVRRKYQSRAIGSKLFFFHLQPAYPHNFEGSPFFAHPFSFASPGPYAATPSEMPLLAKFSHIGPRSCPILHLLAPYAAPALSKQVGSSICAPPWCPARHLRSPRVSPDAKKTDAGESRTGCGRIPQRWSDAGESRNAFGRPLSCWCSNTKIGPLSPQS